MSVVISERIGKKLKKYYRKHKINRNIPLVTNLGISYLSDNLGVIETNSCIYIQNRLEIYGVKEKKENEKFLDVVRSTLDTNDDIEKMYLTSSVMSGDAIGYRYYIEGIHELGDVLLDFFSWMDRKSLTMRLRYREVVDDEGRFIYDDTYFYIEDIEKEGEISESLPYSHIALSKDTSYIPEHIKAGLEENTYLIGDNRYFLVKKFNRIEIISRAIINIDKIVSILNKMNVRGIYTDADGVNRVIDRYVEELLEEKMESYYEKMLLMQDLNELFERRSFRNLDIYTIEKLIMTFLDFIDGEKTENALEKEIVFKVKKTNYPFVFDIEVL